MRQFVCAWLLIASAAFAAEPALPVFTDVTKAAGVEFKHSYGDFELDNIVEGTGSGLCVFDYDGDGWMDLYVCNGRYSPKVSDARGRTLRGKLTNRLYRNNHDGTFTDVSEKAGVAGKSHACGASAADFDGDGDLDLYVLCYGPNEFYRNNGDGTFTDISEKSGLADKRWSLQAAWFDYNGDGKLDVFVVNYLLYDDGKFRAYYPAAGYPAPTSYSGQADALYRNNGDGTFTDVAKEAGVDFPEGRGMGVVVADLDNDGRLDLYVTNDMMANYLFMNQGNGKYSEEALQRGAAFGEGGQGVSSMGPDVGDVDGDGRPDLYIPDMDYGCLLFNKGDYFLDVTTPSNLAVICGQYTGWGGLLLDYDNDGWLDVFVANGDAHHEYTEEAVLARNDGKGRFVDVAKRSGSYFSEKYVGRAAARFDFDNDGDLDVVVSNLNGPLKLLRNDGGNKNRWIAVAAKLPNGKSDAVGARVSVTANGRVQSRDAVPACGYLSQSDPRMHFGLAGAERVERVEIRWPDGRKTELKDVAANQFLKVVQPPK